MSLRYPKQEQPDFQTIHGQSDAGNSTSLQIFKHYDLTNSYTLERASIKLVMLRIPQRSVTPMLTYTAALNISQIEMLEIMLTRNEVVEKTGYVNNKEIKGIVVDRRIDSETRIKRSQEKKVDFDLKVVWDPPSRLLGLQPVNYTEKDDFPLVQIRLSPLEFSRIVRILQKITNAVEIASILSSNIEQLISQLSDKSTSEVPGR